MGRIVVGRLPDTAGAWLRAEEAVRGVALRASAEPALELRLQTTS
jgi:hypothetical protein